MRLGQRRRGERGATLVEAAVVTPVVLLVIFGIFEFSLVFRQYLTVVNTARNTTRTATVAGNAVNADFLALKEAMRSSKALRTNEIQFIVIFKAPTVDSSPETTSSLSGCLTASVAGVCNRYTPSDFSRPVSDFTGISGAPDAAWPPAVRKVNLSGPPDLVGVYIKSHHDASNSIFAMPHDFTDTVVYRIEPQVR